MKLLPVLALAAALGMLAACASTGGTAKPAASSAPAAMALGDVATVSFVPDEATGLLDGKKVLVVAADDKTPTATDAAFIKAFKQWGAAVTVVGAKSATGSEAGQDLVVVSGGDAAVAGKYAQNSAALLILPATVGAKSAFATDVGTEAGVQEINLAKTSGSTAGLTAIVNASNASLQGKALRAFNKAVTANWASPAGEAVVIASLKSDAKKAVSFGYDDGKKDGSGNAVPNRRVVTFLPAGSETNLAQSGADLLLASILWVTHF